MKTYSERKEIIDAINVMLKQAYDSTLYDILKLLQKIEEEEDENDLRAYDEAKKIYIKMALYLGKKLNNKSNK